jgi:hypothetical protein
MPDTQIEVRLLQFLLQFGRKIEVVSATCEKYERVEKYQKVKTDGELEITSRL